MNIFLVWNTCGDMNPMLDEGEAKKIEAADSEDAAEQYACQDVDGRCDGVDEWELVVREVGHAETLRYTVRMEMVPVYRVNQQESDS